MPSPHNLGGVWGHRREENQLGSCILGLWGSLWILNQPAIPTVLKISPLSRKVALIPSPLGRFSDVGCLRSPAIPQSRLRVAGSPIALGHRAGAFVGWAVFFPAHCFSHAKLSSPNPVASTADSLRDQEAQLCPFCCCPPCQKPSPVARIQLCAWGGCTGLNLQQLASSTVLRGSTLTLVAREATRITLNSDSSDKKEEGYTGLDLPHCLQSLRKELGW